MWHGSPDKLTDQQARALANYLVEANSCRPIALEGLSPEMTSVYQEFFKAPNYPVRTTVGSDLIAILVEIDLVVALR